MQRELLRLGKGSRVMKRNNRHDDKALNGKHRDAQKQLREVGIPIFTEKAKAALEFFGDTVSIHQQKGKVYFDVNENNPEVFTTWEDFAAWLEKFADDMASDGYPLT